MQTLTQHMELGQPTISWAGVDCVIEKSYNKFPRMLGVLTRF
jgi:hypothetical protein